METAKCDYPIRTKGSKSVSAVQQIDQRVEEVHSNSKVPSHAGGPAVDTWDHWHNSRPFKSQSGADCLLIPPGHLM